MMDVENIEPSNYNSKSNSMVEDTKTVHMESTFDPGTRFIQSNPLNTLNQNVGYDVAHWDSKETLTEDDAIKEAKDAFGVLKHYIKRMKAIAKEREDQFKDKLMKQNLYIGDLEDKLRVCHTENGVLRASLLDGSLKYSLDLTTTKCLEYKYRLLNLTQELAQVKVSLMNCKEEKANLEKHLGLEVMRKEIEILRKKCYDLSESSRLKGIKEHEMEQEMQKLKTQLGYTMEVCRLVGVRSEDVMDMEKVEEKLRKSRDELPKRWKSNYLVDKLKKEQVTELDRKVEECRQLEEELAKLRKLSDQCGNVTRNVCEYCGM